MPSPPKYHVDFNEHGIYHVFNRTNNKELLFRSDENCRFFLKKYEEYLSPYLETYAWCLLPNHFHLLVKVKPMQSVMQSVTAVEIPTISEKEFISGKIAISEFLELTFKRFFQSYALAYNKMHKRNGNLFYKTFRRAEVNREQYFTQAIIYIHSNPIKHKLVASFQDWTWSSWHTFLSSGKTKILRDEVIEWFGGLDAFIKAHQDAVARSEGFQPLKGSKPF